MKVRLHTILSILILITVVSKADWQPQTSGTSENLYSTFFVNETTGWIVGTNGKILSTTNGGTSWVSQTSGTTQTLFSVEFVSPTVGYIVGSLNTSLKTSNGGANWVSMGIANMTSINDIDFADANTGYVCGGDGDISKTTNGGLNWVKSDISVIDLFVIKAIDANTVFACGISGTILKTTNGGTNWNLQITGSNNYISSLVFADASNGYFTTLGLNEDVRRTTNGGLNWAQVTSPGNSSGLNDLAAVSPSVVYGVGPAGIIRRTTNSGTNWERQPSGDTVTYLRGIYMVSSNVGYVVGNSGRILKTVNGGIGIQQISTTIPAGFELTQNYPNPFNPVTNIEFSVPASGIVKLTVFDVSGRSVTTLVNSKLQAGVYKVDFNAAELSSGIYFYTLESPEFSITKKMILVK